MPKKKPGKKKTINDLTTKERKFIKYYMESGNGSQSALKAGYAHREQSIEVLTKLNKYGLFQEYLEKNGLNDEKIMQVITEGLGATKPISCNVYIEKSEGGYALKDADGITQDFIEVADYSVRHKYLDTLIKLHNKIKGREDKDAENQIDITVQLVQIIKEANKKDEVNGAKQVRIGEAGRNRLTKYLA